MHSLSLLGLLLALLMYAISVSPSLLPRRWWWHSFVSGVLTAAGYCAGWLLQNVGGVLLRVADLKISGSPLVHEWFPRLVLTVFIIWVLRSIVLAYRSSAKVAAMVGMKRVWLREYLLGVVGTLVVAALVMVLAWFYVGAYLWLVRWLNNWLMEPIAWLIVGGAGIGVFLFLSNRVVFRAVMAFFARDAAKRNDGTNSGIVQPLVPERSGSPESLCTWESVGAQGRTFLGRGPSADQIGQVIGQRAMEPVRVYVGMPSNSTDFKAAARLAVEEMHRTGGFDRAIILVSVATGSGWIDEWIVQPMEYLTKGNCATVSMQYSYLFSAAIMLTEMDVCRDSARELFWAIRQEVDTLPVGKRPLVFISGESLGAAAAQDPFADFEQMLATVDGALLVGSPSTGTLSRALTAARHQGSPEVSPVYDSGRQVRFVNEPSQLERDIFGRQFGPWEYPRIVFAQHGSDPVVWFSSKLVFNEPDWLRERVGLDVTPNMRYTPFATYLQVGTDMPMAGTSPGGHGHTYNEELLPIWKRILGFGDLERRGRLELGDWVDSDMLEQIGTAVRFDVDGSGRR